MLTKLFAATVKAKPQDTAWLNDINSPLLNPDNAPIPMHWIRNGFYTAINKNNVSVTTKQIVFFITNDLNNNPNMGILAKLIDVLITDYAEYPQLQLFCARQLKRFFKQHKQEPGLDVFIQCLRVIAQTNISKNYNKGVRSLDTLIKTQDTELKKIPILKDPILLAATRFHLALGEPIQAWEVLQQFTNKYALSKEISVDKYPAFKNHCLQGADGKFYFYDIDRNPWIILDPEELFVYQQCLRCNKLFALIDDARSTEFGDYGARLLRDVASLMVDSITMIGLQNIADSEKLQFTRVINTLLEKYFLLQLPQEYVIPDTAHYRETPPSGLSPEMLALFNENNQSIRLTTRFKNIDKAPDSVISAATKKLIHNLCSIYLQIYKPIIFPKAYLPENMLRVFYTGQDKTYQLLVARGIFQEIYNGELAELCIPFETLTDIFRYASKNNLSKDETAFLVNCFARIALSDDDCFIEERLYGFQHKSITGVILNLLPRYSSHSMPEQQD